MHPRHQQLVNRAIDTAGYAFAFIMLVLLGGAAILVALTVAGAFV